MFFPLGGAAQQFLGWAASITLILSLLQSAFALPGESTSFPSKYNDLATRQTTSGNLSYVADSGICETTPGVHQMSGYIDISQISSMFFWFFEARHNPDNAPFTLWLNGGPGCSSLLGLFQENGPCTVNPDGASTTLNPYSWNNVTNILYLDSPIGAGFSFGTAAADTEDAASWTWRALQILFASPEFSKFQTRSFIFATESFGAHYASEFITYFNSQNADIDSGKVNGVKITVSALAISNGKHDSLIQFGSIATFASDAPGYGPLQDQSIIAQMNDAYLSTGGCKDQLEDCAAAPTNSSGDKICFEAYDNCNKKVMNIAAGGLDKSDLRQSSDAVEAFPPNYYQTYLQSKDVLKKIGSIGTFSACNNTIKDTFNQAGDLGRTSLPKLGQIVDTRIPVLIWVGDADIKADWLGVHDSMVAMPWYGNLTLNNTVMSPFTIDEKSVATYKTVEQFSFMRVFGAGHALPAFQPKVALEVFAQFIANKGFHNVTTKDGASSSPGNGASSRLGKISLLPITLGLLGWIHLILS